MFLFHFSCENIYFVWYPCIFRCYLGRGVGSGVGAAVGGVGDAVGTNVGVNVGTAVSENKLNNKNYKHLVSFVLLLSSENYFVICKNLC